MNRAILIGRLTKDPELRKTQSGKSVSSFNLAVDRIGSNTDTDFIPITAWGNTADNLCKYMYKGALIAVEGHITTERYDSNGSTVYKTYITADQIQFLERANR